MAMSSKKRRNFVRVDTESGTVGGRKLVATSTFPPGECILEESQPYAYILNYNQRKLFCAFCLKRCSTLLNKCSSCEDVRYCSELCKKEDWARCHKQDCKKQRYPDIVHLLSQIIQKQSPLRTQDDNCPTNVDQLVSHEKKLSDTKRNEFANLLQLLKQFIGEDVLPEPRILVKMYGATICNSFSICDNDLNPIAIGIYLRGSMLNHSCAPNCIVVFDGRELQLRTIKDIEEGEECTYSYFHFMNIPTKERRAKLEEQFHFICNCVKCSRDIKALEPDDVSADEEHQGLEKAFKEMKDASDNQDWSKVLQKCEPYLKPSCLPVDHPLLVGVRAISFGVHITNKSWKKAAEIGQLITKPYTDHYGPYHPILGIHLLRMGKLLLNLKILQEATRYLTEAKRVLTVTHGPEHSLMKTTPEQELLADL